MARKYKDLENKDEHFWKRVDNDQTDEFIVHSILKELREITDETSDRTLLIKVSRMRSFIQLLDAAPADGMAYEPEGPDDELEDLIERDNNILRS